MRRCYTTLNSSIRKNRRTIRWTEAGDRPLPDGRFTCPRAVIGDVRPESNYHFEEWVDHQLINEALADLTKIEERILAASLAFDFQNDISNAESKLLEVGNVKACLLLSKLSLAHMIELGMLDSKDPKIARILQEIPATRTRDFAPLMAKLIVEVRDGNSG